MLNLIFYNFDNELFVCACGFVLHIFVCCLFDILFALEY